MSELLQIIGVSFKPSAGGSQLILYLGEKGLVTTVRAKLGKLLQNLENSCKTWKTLAKLGKLLQNLINWTGFELYTLSPISKQEKRIITFARF